MKYAIVSKTDKQSKDLEKRIKKMFSLTYDDINPDIVISLGGDGTFLKAVRKYIDNIDNVLFFGVNTGTLGFYTDWMPCDAEDLEEKIKNKKYIVDNHSLLEFEIKEKKDYALNEIVVLKSNSVQVVDVLINDKKFETFRGTGLCVSTTNGSTAYNKSLGGPVVDPDIPALILTEIAPINSNSYRSLGSPIVLSKKNKFGIKFHDSIISFDQTSYMHKGEGKIDCFLSDKKVRFAKKGDISYFERVKKSFL